MQKNKNKNVLDLAEIKQSCKLGLSNWFAAFTDHFL